jgi:hypothetical protein
MPNARLADKIEKRCKRKESITFTEYHFLRTAKDDFWKLVRMILTLGYSREFFAYGYVLGPLMGSNNPKAWIAWPSTFDLQKDKESRIKSLEEKRITSLVQGLNALNSGMNSENNPDMQATSRRYVSSIIRALRAKDLKTGLNELKDFIFVDSKSKSTSPHLKGCSGAALKGIVNALGAEGVPNIPLINRLNVNEIAGILEKLARSDEILASIGVKNLSDREVS